MGDRALSALRSILDGMEMKTRSEEEKIDSDWTREVISYAPTVLGYGGNDYSIVQRARRSCSDLEAASDLAIQLSDAVSKLAKAARKQVKTLSLRHGLSRLPDEILSDILVLATRPNKRTEDTNDYEIKMRSLRDALHLSHVCSRFRSLILNRPLVWNILSERFPNAEMVLHCIKYSMNSPLDVYMRNLGRPHLGYEFEEFLLACLTSSDRWRNLVFRVPKVDLRKSPEGVLQSLLDNVSSFSRLTNGIRFRSIESVEFVYDTFPRTVDLRDEKFHPYLHWSLPSLERFIFSGHWVPIPLSNSIKELTIRYIYKSGLTLDLPQLTIFFASCLSLKTVFLELRNWRSGSPCDTARIPGVQYFNFDLVNCTVEVVRAVSRSLYFADAKEMDLSLDFAGRANPHLYNSHLNYTKLASEVASQHNYPTHITSLRLSVTPVTGPETNTSYAPPLAMLPKLESVILSSSCGWSDLGLDCSISDGVRAPPISRLTILVDASEWSFVSNWIVAVLARLKEQGDLEKFELLKVDLLLDHDDHELEKLKLFGLIHDYLPEHKTVIGAIDD